MLAIFLGWGAPDFRCVDSILTLLKCASLAFGDEFEEPTKTMA
jgi:hypothetical protein